MVKTLSKHVNSYALVSDKPVMELLKISPDTPLEISTDGQVLVLSPVRGARRKARFKKALSKGNRRFGRALKKLAE